MKSCRLLTFIFAFSVVAFSSATPAHAEHLSTVNTKRFTLYFGEDRSPDANQSMRDIADTAVEVLSATDRELARIFGYNMAEKVVLRFMDPAKFRASTGAPAWTNAMFFNGEISIPVDDAIGVDSRELRRALRHEYVHAIIAEMTAERVPAWIDEGLAQLIEGSPNPILGPALRGWINDNQAIPLSWLEDGFMTLDDDLVAVAYAQSLFAARTLVNTVGLSAIRDYFLLLGEGTPEKTAFVQAFGRPEEEFEVQLDRQIRRWAASGEEQP